MLQKDDLEMVLGRSVPEGLEYVGYKTDNQITNRGKEAWEAENGLLSIWILGMYNPSPSTTVIIPVQGGEEADFGDYVNDVCFGSVPSDYLYVWNDTVFFRGNGLRLGKIGFGPKRSRGLAGSYDAAGKVFTFVAYKVKEAPFGYVNSAWQIQDEPYAGDVINAYNDGPSELGVALLGPFYELETSSPAAALEPNGTMKHVQQTWHMKGSDEQLKALAHKLLGADLTEIEKGFLEK